MATLVERLARFATRADINDLSVNAREQLRIRVLDSLGCAFGATSGDPIRRLRWYVDQAGGNPHCVLLGGGRSSADRAALYNGALVRYLDFNDSFLAPGETCHPSDNLAAILAAAEFRDGGGADFLAGLAVAYQVQCRLSEAAPVRHRGFDHTTQGAYGAAAGAARALGLDAGGTANALAIAGTALVSLRVTRTGALSHWKGLAAPHTAAAAVQAALLAWHGLTGPPEVFEGNKGFMEAISGPFDIDWDREDLESVSRTVIKRFNAEVHAQSALEGILELRALHGFSGGDVESVDVEIFDVAFHIIGGGEEGDKTAVRTKEEADHSLPYMLAVALLDGQVMPGQYAPERIARDDVQRLLRRVTVRPDPALSARFPREMPCRLVVRLKDGRAFNAEKTDYHGFITRPIDWEGTQDKFRRLTLGRLAPGVGDRIVEAVERLDKRPVRELARLLGDGALAAGE